MNSANGATNSKDPLDFLALSRRFLHLANTRLSRIEFLREASNMLLEFSGCDALELVLSGRIRYRWRASIRPEPACKFEWQSAGEMLEADDQNRRRAGPAFNEMRRTARFRGHDAAGGALTQAEIYWRADGPGALGGTNVAGDAEADRFEDARSLSIIPFVIDDTNTGVLKMGSAKPGLFTNQSIPLYEAVVQTFGLAIFDRRAQAALRERVKELTCLYGISQVLDGAADMEDCMSRIVQLLPSAWQFPDVAAAAIMLDRRSFTSADSNGAKHRQCADIIVHGTVRGRVEVVYLEDKSEFMEGPFLPEERHLLNAVAREIALYVDRLEAREEKAQLSEQLRHSDRLATIGELAAGVAHEINEPLGSILGFAQLARKSAKIPDAVKNDLEKIVGASLKAREIVKQLLLFARQTPPNRATVDLNHIVHESISMLEARCVDAGVEILMQLANDLPPVAADAVQLQQVLVNLVVNAVQAMPQGGMLKVATFADERFVSLVVTDTGVGMTPELARQAFNPFFTTKEVGEGTGLGLAVAHGIVTAHDGEIALKSEVNVGTTATVRLPRSELASSQIHVEFRP